MTIEAKSRIKKRVLLKNVMHDAGFPTFQKKKIIYKTRYWEQCFSIPFFWIFLNKIFLLIKYDFV